MGGRRCAGDLHRNLLWKSVTFPWNADTSWYLVSALYANRKPRTFFPLCHVRHGFHGDFDYGRGAKVPQSWGGYSVEALFLFIRWLQNATMEVLLVEGVVAASIVFALSVFCWLGLNRGWMRMLGLLGGSLLAYAGLVL